MKKVFALIIVVMFIDITAYAWSTKTYTTDSDFMAIERENIDINGTGENAKLVIQRNWQDETGVTYPSARHSAALAYDVSGSSAMLFGGRDAGNNALQDFWIYEVVGNKWSQVGAMGTGVRYGHKVVSMGSGQYLFFGGQNNTGDTFNDTWIYNRNTNVWARQNFAIEPSSRAYFSMSYVQSTNKVYLFGGVSGPQLFGDFWVYDVTNGSWSYIISASTPSARYAHGMCYDSNSNVLIVFGGRSNTVGGKTSDLWVYSFGLANWSNIPQPSVERPSPVSDFVFEYMSSIDKCILFGGSSSIYEYFTYLYSYENNEWLTADYPVNPSARDKSAGFVYNGYLPFIFGGDTGNASNETFKYILKSSGTFTVTVTTAVFTSKVWRKILTNFAGIYSSSTTIRFQTAHSDDGISFDAFRGPDGSVSSYYNGAGPHNIWNGHWDRNYLRVKGEMLSYILPKTPELPELKIVYNIRPRPPQLVYPENYDRINAQRPVFVWEKGVDDDHDYPLTYRMQISNNSSFSTPYIDQNFIAENSTAVVSQLCPSNLNEGLWYYRIYSQDNSTSAWSDAYSFTVDTTPPNNITELSARTGNENGSIDLSWISPGDDRNTGEIVNGSFIVRYSSTGPINTEIAWQNTMNESIQPLSVLSNKASANSVFNLQDETTYYFAVKIRDRAGNTSTLSSLSPRAFTNARPSVNLLEPDNYGVFSKVKEISWGYQDQNEGDSVSVSVSLSTDSGVSYGVLITSGLPDKTTCYFWNTRKVSNGTNYKIKVIVTDWRGLPGEAVSLSTFTIFNTNEPPELTLITPNGFEIISGTMNVTWQLTDVNSADTHIISVYLSSNNGAGFLKMVELPGNTTFYLIDSALLKNGTNYLIRINASENNTSEKYESMDISNNEFSVDNNNEFPYAFSLTHPADGCYVSVLKLYLAWENKGDPNSGDNINYTIYLATDSVFTTALIINTDQSNYLFPSGIISEGKEYYWKVKAYDQLGYERYAQKVFNFKVLERSKAVSEDQKVSGEITGGLPAGGDLYISKIAANESLSMQKMAANTAGDRLLKTITQDVYRPVVMDVNETVLHPAGIILNMAFLYNDDDSDNYYHGTNVPVEKLRIACLDEEKSKWKFSEDRQSVDYAQKKITAQFIFLEPVAVFGVNIPNKLLGNLNVFPNPFNAGTENIKIRYVLNKDSAVDIRIFTLIGELVRHWHFDPGLDGKSTGVINGCLNEIQWDGKNGNDALVSNGMYLCIIKAANGSEKQQESINIGVIK